MQLATEEAASVRVHKPAPGTGWRDHYLFDVSKMSREQANRMVSKKLIRLLFEHHRDLVVPEYAHRFFAIEQAKKPDPVAEPQISADVIELPAFLPRSSSAVNKYSLSKRNPHLSNTETPSLYVILAAVMKYFGLSRSRILSARRELKSTLPRQIACYLAAELTQLSLPVIGRDYGGRDHTTVIHANRKIARLIAEDEKIASDVNEIKKIISIAMETV